MQPCSVYRAFIDDIVCQGTEVAGQRTCTACLLSQVMSTVLAFKPKAFPGELEETFFVVAIQMFNMPF